jgi:hypothetical protein
MTPGNVAAVEIDPVSINAAVKGTTAQSPYHSP